MDTDINPSKGGQIRVVLVETSESLNIGMVARAMRNLDFRELVLVAPRDFRLERAEITARSGTHLLQSTKVVNSIDEAVADCGEVVGFSPQVSKNRAIPQPLPAWATEHRKERGLVKTALLFGPEDTGLRPEHLFFCRRVVKIPASDEYSSFNLAQAVLLALWELRASNLGEPTSGRPQAQWREFTQLDKLLDEVLRASGFYRKATSAHIPRIVKRLFRRVEPDEREMRILLGVFSKIAKQFRKEGE